MLKRTIKFNVPVEYNLVAQLLSVQSIHFISLCIPSETNYLGVGSAMLYSLSYCKGILN